MDAEKLKKELGANITRYRKQAGLTQAGLAERINYSDKAVSKWERGESMPDVPTLVLLSEQFGIRVDALLAGPDAPEAQASPGEAREQPPVPRRRVNRGSIQMLCSILVWGIALLAYVVVSSLGLSGGWLTFVYAVPVNAIVLLSLRSAWHDYRWNRACVSGIMWGCLASFHLTALHFFHVNIWRVYLLGLLGELAIFFSFRVVDKPKEEEHG